MTTKNTPSPPAATTSIIESPAFAMAMLQTATAQALANAAQNATKAQRMGDLLMFATTAAGVAEILGSNTKAEKLFEKLEKEYLNAG